MYCTLSNTNFTFYQLSTIHFKLALTWTLLCSILRRMTSSSCLLLHWLYSTGWLRDFKKPAFFGCKKKEKKKKLCLGSEIKLFIYDGTPLQRSLSTLRLAGTAAGNIYRQDFHSDLLVFGSTLLPPSGKTGNHAVRWSNASAHFSVDMEFISLSFVQRDVDTLSFQTWQRWFE